MTAPPDFKCDLVIARYQEKLEWMTKYEEYNFQNIYVYNKGQNDGQCNLKGKECVQFRLKNEGRCDHTYLYHIIKNFDTLADVTVFTKGSSHGLRESKKLKFTVKKVFETKDTVFSVSEHYVPVNIAHHSFSLEYYRSTHHENYTGPGDTEGMTMKLADPRPFGRWYDKNFPGIVTTKAVYSGVFAISKAHVHQHPKSYYESLIKELEGHPNPEVGHYFERAWVAVFNPIPENCLYQDLIHENHMTGGRRIKSRRRRNQLKKRNHTR